MSVATWADVEGGLRTWLRTRTAITTVVSSRIFFGLPETTAFPAITIQRVGGGPQVGEAPLDDALIQFDCWSGIRDKGGAWTVTAALLSELEALSPQLLATGVWGYGASVESVIWIPDPDNQQARYSVTALVTVRAA